MSEQPEHTLSYDGQVKVKETLPQPELTVWYGRMPESNGKSNWTAILHRKGGEGTLGALSEGITIDRSEYPDRVRYEADRVRHLIGELEEEPFILDYDADKHSGYVAPESELQRLQALSVTNIMIDVVPGDGSGEEVYAKSVADVETLISKAYEDLEQAKDALNTLLGASKEVLRVVGMANPGSAAYNRAVLAFNEVVTAVVKEAQ